MTDDAYPRPAELEDHLDDLMEGGAEPPEGSGSPVSTNPNESAAEHEELSVAEADHQNEPGEQTGGGG